jgi:hypothetical protein
MIFGSQMMIAIEATGSGTIPGKIVMLPLSPM